MNLRNLTLSLLLLVPCAVVGAPSRSDVEGSWKCGPYEIKGDEFVVTAIDRPIYSRDGKFTELSTATYAGSDGAKVRMETKHTGTWTLTEDILEIQFSSAEFLSSDNPVFTVAAGQASLDAQMKRKNWGRKRVLGYGSQLVTIPIDVSNKRAEVQVSCSKA